MDAEAVKRLAEAFDTYPEAVSKAIVENNLILLCKPSFGDGFPEALYLPPMPPGAKRDVVGRLWFSSSQVIATMEATWFYIQLLGDPCIPTDKRGYKWPNPYEHNRSDEADGSKSSGTSGGADAG